MEFNDQIQGASTGSTDNCRKMSVDDIDTVALLLTLVSVVSPLFCIPAPMPPTLPPAPATASAASVTPVQQ
jgi:hypothetical protein